MSPCCNCNKPRCERYISLAFDCFSCVRIQEVATALRRCQSLLDTDQTRVRSGQQAGVRNYICKRSKTYTSSIFRQPPNSESLASAEGSSTSHLTREGKLGSSAIVTLQRRRAPVAPTLRPSAAKATQLAPAVGSDPRLQGFREGIPFCLSDRSACSAETAFVIF